jgi:hypothetical protein
MGSARDEAGCAGVGGRCACTIESCEEGGERVVVMSLASTADAMPIKAVEAVDIGGGERGLVGAGDCVVGSTSAMMAAGVWSRIAVT